MPRIDLGSIGTGLSFTSCHHERAGYGAKDQLLPSHAKQKRHIAPQNSANGHRSVLFTVRFEAQVCGAGPLSGDNLARCSSRSRLWMGDIAAGHDGQLRIAVEINTLPKAKRSDGGISPPPLSAFVNNSLTRTASTGSTSQAVHHTGRRFRLATFLPTRLIALPSCSPRWTP